MRGWTIALFLVVAVSFFVDLPPSWAPHIRAVSHYTTPVFLFCLALYMAPGRWVMLHLWSGFFHLTWRDIWRGAGFWPITVDVFGWLSAFAMVAAHS